jgi:hypothetical protein
MAFLSTAKFADSSSALAQSLQAGSAAQSVARLLCRLLWTLTLLSSKRRAIGPSGRTQARGGLFMHDAGAWTSSKPPAHRRTQLIHFFCG